MFSLCLKFIEHLYSLDSDGSGTSDVCVNSTIGADRLVDATNWLQQNNMKALLGEIGSGNNGMFEVRSRQAESLSTS
jgi:hypothetical protein